MIRVEHEESKIEDFLLKVQLDNTKRERLEKKYYDARERESTQRFSSFAMLLILLHHYLLF